MEPLQIKLEDFINPILKDIQTQYTTSIMQLVSEAPKSEAKLNYLCGQSKELLWIESRIKQAYQKFLDPYSEPVTADVPISSPTL